MFIGSRFKFLLGEPDSRVISSGHLYVYASMIDDHSIFHSTTEKKHTELIVFKTTCRPKLCYKSFFSYDFKFKICFFQQRTPIIKSSLISKISSREIFLETSRIRENIKIFSIFHGTFYEHDNFTSGLFLNSFLQNYYFARFTWALEFMVI